MVEAIKNLTPVKWRRWSVAMFGLLGIFVVEFVAQMWNTAGLSATAQISVLGLCGTYFGFDGLSKKAENGSGPK